MCIGGNICAYVYAYGGAYMHIGAHICVAMSIGEHICVHMGHICAYVCTYVGIGGIYEHMCVRICI